jgi:hypothetical protein
MTIAPPTEQELDFAARMERLGVVQQFLADYTGLSQSEVSKIVGGIRSQGEGHRKINDALHELEQVAAVFSPMKPAFEDANAVKAWRIRPDLPNLFRLLTDAQLQQLNASELTVVNARFAECERLEDETAAINEKSRNDWLGYFEETSRGR